MYRCNDEAGVGSSEPRFMAAIPSHARSLEQGDVQASGNDLQACEPSQIFNGKLPGMNI